MSPALEPLQGKYEIVAKLKEGGMGAIYKVRHRLLEEVRVVKVLRPQFEDDLDLNRRFAQEAKAAIRLRHPNVIQIFDFLLEEGVGYIVMEYIDGVDFGELIQRRRLPSLPVAVEAARQSLKALGYLHQQGFVHRDVSPDNLMLGLDFDGKPQVKMIDLGISRQLDSDQRLTASGMFLGKFRYSSPEHFGARGPDGIDQRSDLYSLGIVLYELLTGRYPIRGTESSQLIAGHLFHPPLEFEESDTDGRVPGALRQIVLRALDKDPDKRYPTAKALSADLKKLQAQFPMTEASFGEVRELVAQRHEVAYSQDEGSTQDRLDRGFGMGPTPPPDPTTEGRGGISLTDAPTVSTPNPAGSAVQEVQEAQLTALLTGAETLLRLDHHEQARLQIEAVLQIDPHHVRAQELYAQITGGAPEHAAPPEAPSAAPPPAEPSPAGDRVAGSPPPTVASSVPDPKSEAFERYLETGCKLAGDQHYADAIPHFEEALDIQPDNTAVREMLVEAREKLEEQQQASQKLLESEVRQLRKLLSAGDLDQVRDRILSARRAYGDVEILLSVQQEVEETEAARNRSELAAQLDEAARLRQEGELTQAIRTLEKIRERIQDDPDPAEVRERLDNEEAELEKAHRRAAELDETLFRVEKLVGDGKLVEADRELYQALEAFGQEEALTKLRASLEEIHHQERNLQTRELLDEAAQLAGAGEIHEAVKNLEKARIMAPVRSALQEEIDEAEERYRTQLQEQSQVKTLRGLEAQVRKTLDEDGPEQAQAQLEVLAPRFESSAGRIVFEGLRQAIADAYQERVNHLIHEAGVAIEAKRFDEAITHLEEALAIDSTDEWIQDRLSQAREALEAASG